MTVGRRSSASRVDVVWSRMAQLFSFGHLPVLSKCALALSEARNEVSTSFRVGGGSLASFAILSRSHFGAAVFIVCFLSLLGREVGGSRLHELSHGHSVTHEGL